MKKFLLLCVFALGCGQSKEVESVNNFIPPAPAAIPASPALSAPAMPAPTEGIVRSALKEASEEMQLALKQAYEADRPGAADLYRPLVKRLLAIPDRLNASDCDLAHEMQEIREIRAAIKAASPPIVVH